MDDLIDGGLQTTDDLNFFHPTSSIQVHSE